MADGLFGTNTPRPQLQQTALRPAGIPGSTYVRPQQYEAGSNLNALANALGGLNSSLQAFAARREQKANDPNGDANRLFSAKVAQMSLPSCRQRRPRGRLMAIGSSKTLSRRCLQSARTLPSATAG